MKCGCCGKMSSIGAIGDYGKGKLVCDDCLKYAPSHYGFMSSKDLINYIRYKKSKSLTGWLKRWLKI